jgi:hypothetical protein
MDFANFLASFLEFLLLSSRDISFSIGLLPNSKSLEFDILIAISDGSFDNDNENDDDDDDANDVIFLNLR